MKQVVKRNGVKERLDTNKIRQRLEVLKNDEAINTAYGKLDINSDQIAMLTEEGAYDGITTAEIDSYSAHIMHPMSFVNPDYGDMAGRVIINSNHKDSIHNLCILTGKPNEDVTKNITLYLYEALYANVNSLGKPAPLISPQFLGLIRANSTWIEENINYMKDYAYSFEAFKTLENGYLLSRKNHVNNTIMCSERIQHAHMRVCIQEIACPDDPKAIRKLRKTPEYFVREFTKEEKAEILESYWVLSEKYAVNATPTIFNSGSIRPQLSSCYLTAPRKDSLKGINEWYSDYSFMAKNAGGVGSAIHKIRGTGAYISKTNGYNSHGIKSWIDIAGKYGVAVDQGGGKRPGSHALYLEPWHTDIENFLGMVKKRGDLKSLGVSYGMWIPDEFMRCVERETAIEAQTGHCPKLWYLMCPSVSPGLEKVYDKIHVTEWIDESAEIDQRLEFTKLYRQYIAEGRYTGIISASALFKNIIITQIENGTPYMLYKDSCNRKSNQHDTTLECSNLCTEILEPVNEKETAVCNLANLNLPRFYDSETNSVNWPLFRKVVRIMVKNLDRLIDKSFYPIPKAEYSNKLRRPMGLGYQGLADLFILCGYPYDSDAAKELSFKISETMYMEALLTSADLAAKFGTYPKYAESDAAAGKLQHDLWQEEYDASINNAATPPIYFKLSDEWPSVREKIAKHGLRNSLLIALMPTASTYMITGSNPCFEPFSGAVYKRRAKKGEFMIVNKSLINTLIKLNLWTPNIRNAILNSKTGSIAHIKQIPENIRQLYKMGWDMSSKVLIDHALVRSPFIDQSQSLNIFMETPDVKKLSQSHLYSWRRRIKTGQYYLRSLNLEESAKLNEPTKTVEEPIPAKKEIICTDEICVMCQ